MDRASRIEDIAKSNADAAIDQRDSVDYESHDACYFAYMVNVQDSLVELFGWGEEEKIGYDLYVKALAEAGIEWSY